LLGWRLIFCCMAFISAWLASIFASRRSIICCVTKFGDLTIKIRCSFRSDHICHQNVTIYVFEYRRDVDWWIGFIDHLCTPLGSTSNYSAVANLHTLKITAAPAKPSRACRVFNSVLCQRLLTLEILHLPALTPLQSGEYPVAELLSTVNSTIVPTLLSLPCRARLIFQPSTELTS
jgi:hypothetical protein